MLPGIASCPLPPVPPAPHPLALEDSQQLPQQLQQLPQQLSPARPEPDLLMPSPEESGTSQVALSQTQRQLLRRVRKMYIEKVIQNSERLAYDERVDMKNKIPHPMAQLVNALAHMAVASYWIVAFVLSGIYAAHFPRKTAVHWAYSCISGWLFMWFVLEVVKIGLLTILELSQFNQRRRLHDHSKLKDKVAFKKAMKMKQMSAMAHASGIAVPTMHALLPAPPLPPEPPPPALGDASAG